MGRCWCWIRLYTLCGNKYDFFCLIHTCLADIKLKYSSINTNIINFTQSVFSRNWPLEKYVSFLCKYYESSLAARHHCQPIRLLHNRSMCWGTKRCFNCARTKWITIESGPTTSQGWQTTWPTNWPSETKDISCIYHACRHYTIEIYYMDISGWTRER